MWSTLRGYIRPSRKLVRSQKPKHRKTWTNSEHVWVWWIITENFYQIWLPYSDHYTYFSRRTEIGHGLRNAEKHSIAWNNSCSPTMYWFIPIRTYRCDFRVMPRSPYGLGVVLSHVYPSGEEIPIAVSSRSFNSAERTFSQIKNKNTWNCVGNQALSDNICMDVTFCSSRITNHLLAFLIRRREFRLTTTARLQRYAIFLSGLDYSIEYRNTKSHSNADWLSRLPLPTNDTNTDDIVDYTHAFHVTQLQAPPVTAEEVKKRTAHDPILSRSYDSTMRGWGDNDDSDLQLYFRRRTELTFHQECLLSGVRVVISETLRKDVLNLIQCHDCHLESNGA